MKIINRNIHDDDDDDEKEVTIPVSKLLRTGSGQISHEKPLFPSLNPLGAAVPLVLSLGEQVPYTVNRYLRDYQRDGIKFIHENVTLSRGCILGDDMGLGKTVQVLTEKKPIWPISDAISFSCIYVIFVCSLCVLAPLLFVV